MKLLEHIITVNPRIEHGTTKCKFATVCKFYKNKKFNI